MTIWYVAPEGVESVEKGTRGQPFTHVDQATAVVKPGDTVYFLEGTYQNASYGVKNANGDREIWEKDDEIIKINNLHGTAEAPITYAAEPGAHVILQYDGAGAIVARASSHINFEGFDIRGPQSTVTLQETLDAQWSYRMATSLDANGKPVYEYLERDPSQVMATTIAAQMTALENSGIDQSGSGKPILFNASAIALPYGSHHIVISGNRIDGAAAHAVASQGGNDYITISNNLITNCTQLSSNGTHAISFKSLDSLDDSDAVKVILDSNTLIDNYNLLISWVMTKKFVTMAIDEGKTIHVQNCESRVDPVTGNQWDHGQVQISNNIVIRSGNAAITVNEARGVIVANNTMAESGYINQLIDQDDDVDSPWQGFFSGQGLPADYRVAGGGLRFSGTDDVTVVNNLISMSDDRLFAIDASPNVTAATVEFANNLHSGGDGLRIRATADLAELSSGFIEVEQFDFVNAAEGDYRLSVTSDAIDAGFNTSLVAFDETGLRRTDAIIDVGAFEYIDPAVLARVLEADRAESLSLKQTDSQKLHDWAEQYEQRNHDGVLVATQSIMDDGTGAVWKQDLQSQNEWADIRDYYTRDGHLNREVQVFDDGSRVERLFDVAKTSDWFSKIQTFDQNNVMTSEVVTLDQQMLVRQECGVTKKVVSDIL
jgi:hypothetical protein